MSKNDPDQKRSLKMCSFWLFFERIPVLSLCPFFVCVNRNLIMEENRTLSQLHDVTGNEFFSSSEGLNMSFIFH